MARGLAFVIAIDHVRIGRVIDHGQAIECVILVADGDIQAGLLLIGMADAIAGRVVVVFADTRVGAVGAEQSAEAIASIARVEAAWIGHAQSLVVAVVDDAGEAAQVVDESHAATETVVFATG